VDEISTIPLKAMADPAACQPFIRSCSTRRDSARVISGAVANTMPTLTALVWCSAVNNTPWVRPRPTAPMKAASRPRPRRKASIAARWRATSGSRTSAEISTRKRNMVQGGIWSATSLTATTTLPARTKVASPAA
jgi:hypothetical protein